MAAAYASQLGKLTAEHVRGAASGRAQRRAPGRLSLHAMTGPGYPGASLAPDDINRRRRAGSASAGRPATSRPARHTRCAASRAPRPCRRRLVAIRVGLRRHRRQPVSVSTPSSSSRAVKERGTNRQVAFAGPRPSGGAHSSSSSGVGRLAGAESKAPGHVSFSERSRG